MALSVCASLFARGADGCLRAPVDMGLEIVCRTGNRPGPLSWLSFFNAYAWEWRLMTPSVCLGECVGSMFTRTSTRNTCVCVLEPRSPCSLCVWYGVVCHGAAGRPYVSMNMGFLVLASSRSHNYGDLRYTGGRNVARIHVWSRGPAGGRQSGRSPLTWRPISTPCPASKSWRVSTHQRRGADEGRPSATTPLLFLSMCFAHNSRGTARGD